MTEAAPPRLLLVDDDASSRLVAQAMLRQDGFAVDTAASGEAALTLLAATADPLPDLILLDAVMPGLDGFQTCERIREMPGCEALPVVMLTVLDSDDAVDRAFQVGATDFVAKGTSWRLLAARLRHQLRAACTLRELARSRERLARAQDLARMGSLEWQPDEPHPRLSAEALRALGLPPLSLPRWVDLLRLVSRDERHSLLLRLRELQAFGAPVLTDVALHLPDGRQRIVHLELEPEVSFERQGTAMGFAGMVQDVTERRQAEDRIRQLAHFDALTHLPNRRQLLWRIDRAADAARRQGHRAAVLLIDLDRFKNVNDTMGHSAGDELLVEVARRLRTCVRHTDQVLDLAFEPGGIRQHRSLEAVGRLGGDEFVALLPEVGDQADAERVAQRMLAAFREPVVVGAQDFFITASIGIALCPDDGQTAADLLRNADLAMYTAKDQGRNAAALYTPQLAAQGRVRLALESALHKALERQELVLHYQPKVDVETGRMVGVEALMRWLRQGQLVPPGDFIPLAEESGLIVPMSEWALREATRQAGVWQQEFGFDQSIAVNLPNRLFERPDLVAHIQACVQREAVPHQLLQLEITESGLMKDLHGVIPTLERLNAVGIQISIDDFGTGYSSLSYLTSLPLSELKIDRSFVKDLGQRPQANAVAAAIVALARSLGLRVVAEGVETTTQLDALCALGCRVMQGYLFAKPMPADAVPHWVKTAVLARPSRPLAPEATPQ